MIGIYKITNKTTGRTYIGQSANIERRFAEHRTPKPGHNPALNEDIKKYGLDDFVFSIIELCEKNELSEKELYHIRKEKPYYNVIGKPRGEETKRKLRESGKRQWENNSEERKKLIVEKNLTGPRIGHKVSEETRQKLRLANLGKRRKPVIIVETGLEFPSAKECAEYLGVTTSSVRFNLEGRTKRTKGYRIEYK